MRLTKSDFLQYLACDKSFWLSCHKPELVPETPPNAYTKFLSRQGYEVERIAKLVLTGCEFQTEFEDSHGVYARADAVTRHPDGAIDIYEVKSTTGALKKHFQDFAFQMVAARRSGEQVKRFFAVTLNKEFIREGEIDPVKLLRITDVTEDIIPLVEEIDNDIEQALGFLSQTKIDENFCNCLYLGRGNHCDTFDYFNPKIPNPSIYTLPRMNGKRLAEFVDQGRFDLDDIAQEEVTSSQLATLVSAQTRKPVIDHSKIAAFLSDCEYPLYFLDYETIAHAVPKLDGLRPYQAVPFQYSLHVAFRDRPTEHFEYLADSLEIPEPLVIHMSRHIGPKGSVIVWNKSFEKGRNTEMGMLFPNHAEFLLDLNDRMQDLMEVYAKGYVDIAFQGSASIKKVLPILEPDLDYSELAVSEGTDAMMSWLDYIAMNTGGQRDQLRNDLLEYCKLDTYAMVRLFEKAQNVQNRI